MQNHDLLLHITSQNKKKMWGPPHTEQECFDASEITRAMQNRIYVMTTSAASVFSHPSVCWEEKRRSGWLDNCCVCSGACWAHVRGSDPWYMCAYTSMRVELHVVSTLGNMLIERWEQLRNQQTLQQQLSKRKMLVHFQKRCSNVQ